MPLSLELIRSSTLPLWPRAKWTEWASHTFSRQGLIAFPDSPNQVWIGKKELEDRFEYAVPSGARFVALHPSWQYLSTVTANSISITDRNGEICVQQAVRPEWGLPTACIFDHEGKLLLVTFSFRNAGIACLFKTENLEFTSKVELGGDEDSIHTLIPHPTEPVVLLDVGNGQHETFTYLFELQPNAIKVLRTEITAYPKVAQGFTSDGKSLLRYDMYDFEFWSYPEWMKISSVKREDNWSGTLDKNYFSTVIRDRSGRRIFEECSLPDFTVTKRDELPLPEGTRDALALGNGFVYSTFIKNKQRISPADRLPDTQTFQLWKIHKI